MTIQQLCGLTGQFISLEKPKEDTHIAHVRHTLHTTSHVFIWDEVAILTPDTCQRQNYPAAKAKQVFAELKNLCW